MRHLFFTAALFCSVSILSAQIPSALNKLQGTWLCKDCDQRTWSAWNRTTEGILVNRTFTLIGQDTVEVSRLEIFVRPNKQVALRQIQPGKLPETFRLTRVERFEILWENENLISFQPFLRMAFYGSKRLVFKDTEGEMDFRRKRMII